MNTEGVHITPIGAVDNKVLKGSIILRCVLKVLYCPYEDLVYYIE